MSAANRLLTGSLATPTRAAGLASTSGRQHSTTAYSSTPTFRHRGLAGQHLRAEAAAGAASLAWDNVRLVAEVLEQQNTDVSGESLDLSPAAALAEQRHNNRPLKINRDLLLYRARVARKLAFRASTATQRHYYQRTAEEGLRKCLAMDATDGRAYVSLGKVMVDQRRFDEARALYEDGSTATGGENAHIWTAWAVLEVKQGGAGKARKLFDAATVADKQHAAAWHAWGLLEKREGNLLRARDLWMKGIKNTADRPNPYLYQSLAVLAAEMRCTEEARKWFTQGTRTLQAWALMEAKQGDNTAVRYLFKKGLDSSPRSRYLHLAWAMWEKSQGKRDNARKLFERGHALNRRDPALLQAWAVMEEEDCNYDEARELFKKGSEADPMHVYIWQAWGVMEYRLGNLDAGRELFQQGVWADPNMPDVAKVFQAWGVLENQAGNVSLARELFKCAVKADPKSEPTWLAWAQLEEAQGSLLRANELRNYRMQARVEVVLPSSFDYPDTPLAPILTQIRKWFDHFDAAQQPQRRSGPQILAGAKARGSSSDASIHDVLNVQEMRMLNASDELPLP